MILRNGVQLFGLALSFFPSFTLLLLYSLVKKLLDRAIAVTFSFTLHSIADGE